MGGQESKIKNENGVTIVHNPSRPISLSGGPIKLTFVEDFVIGEHPDDEDSMFSKLRTIQVDGQENIIALDYKDVSVKIF